MKRQAQQRNANRPTDTGRPRNLEREPFDLRGVVAGAVIFVAVLLVYVPAYDADFIWDDDDYVYLNPLLQEPGGLAEIWNPFSPRNPQYYPLVFTTFWVEWRLWGANATGYHAVNIMLHALNACLLLVVLRRLRVPGAAAVAALFAVHPVCVESVAWITERKNVLSAFFYFLAALAYLRFDDSGRRRWFALTVACFLFALFSKTVTASLPIALLLALWWQRRPLHLKHAVTLGPMLILGALLGMLTRAHEYTHVLGSDQPFAHLSGLDRLLLAARRFWFYPGTVVWPVDLAFMYERWQPQADALWPWLFPLAGVAALLLLLVARWRGWIGRGPLAAFLLYSFTIFPALGFVNIAPLRFASVADHFQYLAMIGTLLFVVSSGWVLLQRALKGSEQRVIGPFLTIALAVPLAALTFAQSRIYENRGTLWADTIEKSPDNYLARINYATWLREQNDLDGAAAQYEHVLRISEPVSEATLLAHSNLAGLRYRQDRFQAALRHADAAAELSPSYPFAHYHRGRALWRLGRFAEAEAALERLLALRPDPGESRADWDIRRRVDDAVAWYVLAEVRGALGRYDAAAAAFAQAIQLAPDRVPLHQARLESLQAWRQYGAAIRAAQDAIDLLEPDTPFRLQLAWLLATAPDASDRDGSAALNLAQALVSRTGAQQPAALSALAAAEAETGNMDAALQTARAALAAARESGVAPLLQRIQLQLRAYESGKHLRLPPPAR